MNTGTAKTKKQRNLLDQLQTLLQKQVEMFKNGNIHGLETAAEQANRVIAEMTETQFPQSSQDKEKGEEIAQLYQKLELMIEVEKETISKQMRKVANGKKMVQAYHYKK